MELGALQYGYVALAAMIVGFTKTSVGGVGILAVLLMALAIPGKASPGVLLPLLIAADVMAVIWYRRACRWDILLKLMPVTALGVLGGAVLLRAAPDTDFERLIGWTILAMLALDLSLNQGLRRHMQGRAMTTVAGVLAGAASMVANAAGPIFGIYLLQAKLAKNAFVGTRSWFFLAMNTVKLPFAIGLGLVTPATLALDAAMLPMILGGAFLGRALLGWINIALFAALIRIAALTAAMRLIFG